MDNINLDKIIFDGRAVDQVLDCGDLHGVWYRGSEKILGNGVVRSGVEHPVTPTIINTEACRKLLHHIIKRTSFIDRDWMTKLLRRVPWSEYTLYYTFLEMSGEFDKYHIIVNRPVLYNPYNAVWYPRQFAEWMPDTTPGRALFEVVQSTAKASPAIIRQKLGWTGHDFDL